jgi:hypothetical protein
MFKPAAHYDSKTLSSKVLILGYGPNPSTDYYFPSTSFGNIPVQHIDIRKSPPEKLEAGSFVVIVRYINREWGNFLRRNMQALTGVAYFMDDDMPAVKYAKGLPLRYRLKVSRLYGWQKKLLSSVCSEIWVSTENLVSKYSSFEPKLIKPKPMGFDEADTCRVTYFYHGTASHMAEWRWLVDVVGPLQSKNENLTFIGVGNKDIRKLFNGIPNVIFLHHMDWGTYKQSLPAIRHDIGLAPIISNGFNLGRSHTKFFDITRLGAVGIYSPSIPYADFIRNGIDGVFADNTPESWQQMILELSQFKDKRLEILRAAEERVRSIEIENLL